MDLYNLIPNNHKNWSVKKKYLYFLKYENIPVCYIEEGCVFVFLDKKIKRQILSIIKHLLKLNVEFFLVSPSISNPSYQKNMDYNYDNVYNYIRAFTDEFWLKELEKINFDLTDNLVKFVNKYDCNELIKTVYDEILKLVKQYYYDYYTNSNQYGYSLEIRENYLNVLRQIQLTIILN